MYVVLCEPYKILQLTPAFPTGPYVPYRQRSVECELGFMHVSTHLLQKRSSVYHDSAACTTIQQRVPRFSSVYHDSAACTTIQQRVPRFSSMYHDSAACTTIQQHVPRFSSVLHDSAACTTLSPTEKRHPLLRMKAKQMKPKKLKKTDRRRQKEERNEIVNEHKNARIKHNMYDHNCWTRDE
eukprot:scpid47054/ scgid5083/ 